MTPDPGEDPRAPNAGETQQYQALVTHGPHPPEIESGIQILCQLYRKRHTTYVAFLRGQKKGRPGEPGRQNQSPAWREADAGYFAGLTTLAAILGSIYPPPSGRLPINDVAELIQLRVGPLCTGWSSKDNDIIDSHHPAVACPIHSSKEAL